MSMGEMSSYYGEPYPDQDEAAEPGAEHSPLARAVHKARDGGSVEAGINFLNEQSGRIRTLSVAEQNTRTADNLEWLGEQKDRPSAEHSNHMISTLLARNAQLQKRVKMFQEGYRDKAFEVTALEIQILDIKATGYNERLERNFESMKRKCLVAIEERNEAREARVNQSALMGEMVEALTLVHRRFNSKDENPYCWCSEWDWTKHTPNCAAARAILAKIKETR